MQLARNRLALHTQLEIVLFLATFRVQRDQTEIHIRLRNTLHAQVQFSGNLIGGFHVTLDAHASNGQRLPAQVVGGNVRQQLRRIDSTAHFHQAFCRPAQARQRVVEVWRINRRIQIEIFNPQLAFDIGGVASQRDVHFRDNPLQITVAAQRPFHQHFVLLHVAGDFDFRNFHLPASAVQTPAGFDQTVEFRRPVRHLFGGVDARQFQLTAPADRLLPVE
ncbi:hypothetical protein D3C80_889200 [compost metagenome]